MLFVCSSLSGAPLVYPNFNPLQTPPVGEHQLRILSPTLLELTYVSTKKLDGALETWNLDLPEQQALARQLHVKSNHEPIPIATVGFRRRVLYAPLKKYDLRIGNSLFLRLGHELPSDAKVEVTDPSERFWKFGTVFQSDFSPSRWTPVIHVNQVGYAPNLPKHATVGYYLGDMGEMEIPPNQEFHLIDLNSKQVVFRGKLKSRNDLGFPAMWYRNVFEADFTSFETPGCYAVEIPGLGVSYPFWIHPGTPANFARALALGFYHQRCGDANRLPFTRFVHQVCHYKPADIPTPSFENVEKALASNAENTRKDPENQAPVLRSIETCLFPFKQSGKIDVSMGHHDAGDYSKYVINSAQLIHHLVFAADAFPGVSDLDNLGIPESGDGKSDVLQIAKWEADFLAKMQDSDGGFYFLVYPRDRPYEDNVLPDAGDPQIVAPKNTSATAAATAALAQIASSPRFKQQFPEDAARYLEIAKKGWSFLVSAWKRFGRNGSYQRITHYGDFAGDKDEILWAATEMYLATGDPVIHQMLVKEFNPCDPETWLWSWWSLYESYGCAARSYAFADKTGRVATEKLDPGLLEKCRRQIQLRAKDCRADSENSAYGTSVPNEAKRAMRLGWFFSSSTAFDILVAHQLEPSPGYVDAIIHNMDFEAGCNPLNLSYITGLGWYRPHEIVHQYAQNDGRALPPSGLLVGNAQTTFPAMRTYGKDLNALSYPSDDDPRFPYPFYDRWGDTFNVSTEFTIVELSRTLANFAYWMAQSPLKDQPWKSASGKITIDQSQEGPRAHLEAPGMDMSEALIVWESQNQEPVVTQDFAISKKTSWIEVEAQWPDGRRVFAHQDL